jgi:hypothetical protein
MSMGSTALAEVNLRVWHFRPANAAGARGQETANSRGKMKLHHVSLWDYTCAFYKFPLMEKKENSLFPYWVDDVALDAQRALHRSMLRFPIG